MSEMKPFQDRQKPELEMVFTGSFFRRMLCNSECFWLVIIVNAGFFQRYMAFEYNGVYFAGLSYYYTF